MRRIVVGLDGSPHSSSATKFAVRYAKEAKAKIIGVGVVDIPEIQKSSFGAPIGAVALAMRAERTKIENTEEKLAKSFKDFTNYCNDQGVESETTSKEGEPFEKIVEETHFADAVFVGTRTSFDYQKDCNGDTLRSLLKYSTCPIIATPENMKFPESVLFAYDGSNPSIRSIKAFARQNRFLKVKSECVILRVGVEDKESRYDLERVQSYLKDHSIQSKIVFSDGDPGETIYHTSKVMNPTIVVMGAYKAIKLRAFTGLSDLIFGSSAEEIIQDAGIPLFIYH